MIRILDVKKRAVAERVLAVQKSSYMEEMKWIDQRIPLVDETAEAISNSGEKFLGFFMGDILAGFISYIRIGYYVDIHRVAVDPKYFRKGIAEALLRRLENVEGTAKTFVVTVATGNFPGKALYAKAGFVASRPFRTDDGLEMVEMEKKLNHAGCLGND